MKRNKIYPLLLLILLCLLLSSCSNTEKLKDGYYKAEVSEFDEHGWKEFVSVCVMENQIVSVEYNARNRSGFIKSWDMAYMRNMQPVSGTYPNQYTRTYAAWLLENQNAEYLDAISGASTSAGKFILLAAAVTEHAKKGDTSIAIIEI